MGFLTQDAPEVDYATWVTGSRSEKIRPMAEHWAQVGFGTPVVLHLFFVLKVLAYVAAAWLIVLSTDGIDGFTQVK
ncbi:MAG: rane protein, partial [Aeromicrobium sp.]|nr:rane protein [Aeromicrobium sp.]